MALIEYVALVILGALVLAWEAWSPGQAGAEPMTLLFWVLANMLGELLWLPAPKQRGYLSMATAANFATLLVLPVSLAVTVTVLAGALVDLVFRHRRWYQVLFNASVCCIAVFSASRVFTSICQGRDGLENLLSPLNAGALTLPAVTYFLLNTWLVGVGADQRPKPGHVWTTTLPPAGCWDPSSSSHWAALRGALPRVGIHERVPRHHRDLLRAWGVQPLRRGAPGAYCISTRRCLKSGLRVPSKTSSTGPVMMRSRSGPISTSS
jgi:hypothetical protein